ncbi:hypothetical protein SH2C18_11770 [Clostridium sediminicola]|uniref:hypothetical protein n=1 Tax=Clostridium sediminicola TaxID=3114879 RepID=UPI0031F1C715
MIGIGIGIIITCLILMPFVKTYDSSYVEKKAREFGMVYPDEVKVLENSEVNSK